MMICKIVSTFCEISYKLDVSNKSHSHTVVPHSALDATNHNIMDLRVGSNASIKHITTPRHEIVTVNSYKMRFLIQLLYTYIIYWNLKYFPQKSLLPNE